MNQISAEELHNLIKENKHPHVLDVREEDEYQSNNMGGRLWPLSKLKDMNAEGIKDWQHDEIIIHCHSGQRSMQACVLLETMGFPFITNLKGGIKEWQEKYGSEKVK